MKRLIRSVLINYGAIWATTQIIPAVVISGGVRGWIIAVLSFMVASLLLTPLIKILLLPLNLLTLGLFSWLGNVLVLYFLVNVIPSFKILPYTFEGLYIDGFVIPTIDLTTFQVVIIVSFIIGLITHFINWLIKH